MLPIKPFGQSNLRPYSEDFNSPDWPGTRAGRLHGETGFFVRAVSDNNLILAQRRGYDELYAWRVVGVEFTIEDSTITYFKAIDPNGLPVDVPFGVNFDSLPQAYWLRGSDFRYAPEFGNRYQRLVENKFYTPERGGYTAQPLDLNHMSEGVGFGLTFAGGDSKGRHQCAIVTFQLLPVNEFYPNCEQG